MSPCHLRTNVWGPVRAAPQTGAFSAVPWTSRAEASAPGSRGNPLWRCEKRPSQEDPPRAFCAIFKRLSNRRVHGAGELGSLNIVGGLERSLFRRHNRVEADLAPVVGEGRTEDIS